MNDTISAISTAYGEGGIGIVRMSGSRSYEILSDIFDNIDKVENRKLTYGHIRDPRDGRTVDEVLVAYMKAPHTYTCLLYTSLGICNYITVLFNNSIYFCLYAHIQI